MIPNKRSSQSSTIVNQSTLLGQLMIHVERAWCPAIMLCSGHISGVFGRHLVQITAGVQTILNDVLCGSCSSSQCLQTIVGWDSIVSTATRYEGRSGDRIPVGARFSTPVQTGTGAYPASCTMGTVSFPGVKRPGRGIDHPPPSSTKVKERVELYLYFPSGPSWPVLG
jgi:hypothetical protein